MFKFSRHIPFSGCLRWQSLLTRRADGKIAAAQWGLLQDHLASCERCRAAAQADDALHDTLDLREPTFGLDTARAFDDRVLASLAVTPRPQPLFVGVSRLWTRCRDNARTRCKALSFDLLAQVGGGAVVAAGLTSLFLLSALHSGSGHSSPSGLWADRQARENLQRSVLPVPLEALLDTPSPRAAMLWTMPGHARHSHSSHPAPALSAPDSRPAAGFEASPRRANSTPRTTPARPAGEQRTGGGGREAFG